MFRRVRKKGKILIREIQFEFLAPHAKEVYLVGSFNNWDTGETPMKRGKDGIWRAILPLEAGKYEYRFLADGQWEDDPSCSSWVPNEFGSRNCLRIVG